MQLAPQENNPQNLEMSLREQLLAVSGSTSHATPYPPPPTASAPPEHPYQPSDSASPHDHLDPGVTGQQLPYGMGGDSTGDDALSPQGGKGKRELSTSKRAAQNRAAQRAFRQRKEGYIKKLEEQVKEFQSMEQSYRALQTENYQLRDYIVNLQSRLLETQSDYPPAPSHINLSASLAQPSDAAGGNPSPPDQVRREIGQADLAAQHDGISQLQAAAAAQANDAIPHESPYGLGADYPNKRQRANESNMAAKAVV